MTKSYKEYFISKTKELNNDDYEFINWMNLIEYIVENKLGLKLLDLPDEMYRVYFEDGITYEKMAKMVIDNNNMFFL